MIVYTCGTFDIFHIGHLNLLKSARALGDRLIVAVSTDDVVNEYKPARLVTPFEQRIEIVRAIRFVDEVMPQTDRDKFRAWMELRYNILAVGDDWLGTPEFNEHEKKLSAVGAKVVYLPYTRGVSSSGIRRLLETRGVNNHGEY